MGAAVKVQKSGFPLRCVKTATAALCVTLFMPGATGAINALESFAFHSPGAEDGLQDALRGASLLVEAERQDSTDPQELFSAAQSDYARILGALYAYGHYSGIISIRIDGREAAYIPPLSIPTAIRDIQVQVIPGPRFHFDQARIAPLAPDTELPEDFRPGALARSPILQETVTAATDGWRAAGHAKARVVDERVTADHRRAEIDAAFRLQPGPLVRFGELVVIGNEKVRTRRIEKIAGLPEGEVFSPDDLDDAARRLRRTGTFTSVSLSEAETLGPGDTLDITATVVEAKPRRLGFGAEVSSSDGLALSGYWLHRNLLGGAESFRINGEIAGIGGTDGGPDYTLGLTYSRPATLTPDTALNVATLLGHVDKEDYRSDNFNLSVGLSHYFSSTLSGDLAIAYYFMHTTEDGQTRDFELLALPLGLTWDRRDNLFNPARGFYLNTDIEPFYGFGSTGSGGRIYLDGRGYYGFGAENRVILAGRTQIGSILGSPLYDTPRDFLFYSGGGGTVRGQPFQSLGIRGEAGRPDTGGVNFLAASAEIRTDVTPTIGVVGFIDAGYVSAVDFFDDSGAWHAGAGLGLRYNTGIGPIRLDVAGPVHGDTGDGIQIYVGIGQAF